MYLELQGCYLQRKQFEVQADASQIQDLVPDGFELQIKKGFLTFWNIEVCTIADLRPAGLPEWCGYTFDLATYRLPVRVRSEECRALKGLFVVHSESHFEPIEKIQEALPQFSIHPAAPFSFVSVTKEIPKDRNWPLLSCDSEGWIISTNRLILDSNHFLLQTGTKEGRVAPKQPKKHVTMASRRHP